MTRPLVLLPPSKGKAAGGDGPRFGRVAAAATGPLGDARRTVLAAVLADVDELDDTATARLAGVGAGKVDAARKLLLGLADAPTLPARHRYTGIVHGNAGLAGTDPATTGADVRIVSPLLGLAALDDLVPDYRLEFAARLPSLGGIAPWWRSQLVDELARLSTGRRVWDLLPAEHARVWDASVRDAADERIEVVFLGPDARPANAARTKVCKGRLTATLLARPDLDPAGLAMAAEPGPGWQLRADPGRVTAVCRL